MKFPPNYYNLQSSPKPIGTVNTDSLKLIPGKTELVYFNPSLSNIATLKDFTGYKGKIINNFF